MKRGITGHPGQIQPGQLSGQVRRDDHLGHRPVSEGAFPDRMIAQDADIGVTVIPVQNVHQPLDRLGRPLKGLAKVAVMREQSACEAMLIVVSFGGLEDGRQPPKIDIRSIDGPADIDQSVQLHAVFSPDDLRRSASVATCRLMNDSTFPDWHGTTILAVRKNGKTVIAGDGQVSMGPTIVKGKARKVRTLASGKVLAGFAGATADAFTLIERLEGKLEQYPDQLARACVDLAKDWRTDRYLRRLEAMLLVADKDQILTVTGVGDVLEPEYGVAAVGSGGNFALAAARALIEHSDKDAETIAREAMKIAAEICVYTNGNLTVETLG